MGKKEEGKKLRQRGGEEEKEGEGRAGEGEQEMEEGRKWEVEEEGNKRRKEGEKEGRKGNQCLSWGMFSLADTANTAHRRQDDSHWPQQHSLLLQPCLCPPCRHQWLPRGSLCTSSRFQDQVLSRCLGLTQATP